MGKKKRNQKPPSSNTTSFKADFERRTPPTGVSASDAFGIYALSVFVNESDLSALMADALTGGDDDKKADFIYMEAETERAFIGQSYLANTWGKVEAKANKAAALGTAVTWLLSSPITKLPEQLRRHAEDLRKAIAEGVITKLYLLFAHNCHESKNVRDELDTAASTARAICGKNVTVFAQELGCETLERLFQAIDKDILVIDEVTFDISNGYYEVEGPKWTAIATRVNGSRFHELYSGHSDNLFSANIRSYLGVLKKKKGNINADIRNTVIGQPENFWVFNNGITVLTNGYRVRGKRLTVQGVSVINGAQTTGVLGECLKTDAENTLVPCRFVKCGDPATIESIIAYNNTQNAVKSFDWRSNDRTQAALATDFDSVGIVYVYRRSMARRAPTNSIHVETVAQGMASFHGDFQLAIRQKSSIFDDDAVYDRVFPRHISANHVFLVQCLLDAVDSFKLDLRSRDKSSAITTLQRKYLELLEFSTAKQFVVAVVGGVAEQILGKVIQERHKWRVKQVEMIPDRSKIRDAWKQALFAVMPKIARAINSDPQAAVRSTEGVEAAIAELADYLESHGDELGDKFKRLRQYTEVR